MMHKRKLIPFLGLLLLLAGGPGLRMIERAYAICCPQFGCGRWQTVVYGEVTVTNPKAHVTVDGVTSDFDVSSETLAEFRADDLIGKPVIGLIVFTEKQMTGFAPNNRMKHHDTVAVDKAIKPGKVVETYNELFVQFVKGTKGAASSGSTKQ